MDISVGMLDSEENVGVHFESAVERLTYTDLLPSKGSYLGLDISKTSTGVTLIEDGSLSWSNITLKTQPKDYPHQEAGYRRDLYRELSEIVEGRNFDLIAIEDVYISEYAQTTRLLVALNTVIDDLILDGKTSTKEFLRLANGTWKSWLALLDPDGLYRAANDKDQIKNILASIGLEATGKGAQDRLDSAGILLGYLVKSYIEADTLDLPSGGAGGFDRHLKLANLSFSYHTDKDQLVMPSDCTPLVYEGRPSEKGILAAINSAPQGTVYVSKKPVSIGRLASKLGLTPYPFGGYLAFWASDDFALR